MSSSSTEPRAGNLSLVSGVLALDFANTAGGRNLPCTIEYLHHASDLLDWTLHASVISRDAAESARRDIASDPALAEELLASALELREATHRIGSALAYHRSPAAADLDILKRYACATLEQADLTARDSRNCTLHFRSDPLAPCLLGPIAWSAMDLFLKGDLTRLKQCPAEDCGWLFLDTSKNKSRRWCDMSTCGNRTKARRHRQASA